MVVDAGYKSERGKCLKFGAKFRFRGYRITPLNLIFAPHYRSAENAAGNSKLNNKVPLIPLLRGIMLLGRDTTEGIIRGIRK